MKRYRIINYRFDSRATDLKIINLGKMTPLNQKLRKDRVSKIRESILNQFGISDFEGKVQRFHEFGDIPLLIQWEYMDYLLEIRKSYVIAAYYPSLVASCTLAERMINHLFLSLRADYQINKNLLLKNQTVESMMNTPRIANWDTVTAIIDDWGVLSKPNITLLKELRMIRDNTVHFDHEMDADYKSLALKAIKLVQQIIYNQYDVTKQLFILYDPIDGAFYIKNEVRLSPFFIKIIKPYTQLVSYMHKVDTMNYHGKILIQDNHKFRKYEDLTDEIFLRRRHLYLAKNPPPRIKAGEIASLLYSTEQ